MSDWQKNIGAITLFVEDVPTSRAFYQHVFDLAPFEDGETNAGFMLGDQYLFLTAARNASEMIAPVAVGSAANGPRHVFAIIVADVDGVAAELKDKGVALINGPEDRFWGMRTLNFADPDGYVWEIATPL